MYKSLKSYYRLSTNDLNIENNYLNVVRIGVTINLCVSAVRKNYMRWNVYTFLISRPISRVNLSKLRENIGSPIDTFISRPASPFNGVLMPAGR